MTCPSEARISAVWSDLCPSERAQVAEVAARLASFHGRRATILSLKRPPDDRVVWDQVPVARNVELNGSTGQ